MKKTRKLICRKRLLAIGISVMLTANPFIASDVYASELSEQNNIEQVQADNNIVSFLALEQSTLNYQFKPALESVIKDMPEELGVSVSTGEQYVDVEKWICQENYDENLGVYHFAPQIDAEIADEVELPVITVNVEDETEGPAGYMMVEDCVEAPVYDDNDSVAMFMDVDEDIPTLNTTSEELPSYYNNFDLGNLPAIRNQGAEGACWTFASLGAIETDMIMQGKADKGIDLAELHLAYFSMHNSDDPKDCRDGDTVSYSGAKYLSHGGNGVIASRTLANKIGAVREAFAPYSNGNAYQIPEEYATDINYIQLKEVGRISVNDRDSIKKAVMSHGSVTCSLYSNTGAGRYTVGGVTKNYTVRYSATYNSWYGTIQAANHNVMIVGWDDSFSKDNFYEGCKPEGDGAWLIRNSWGLDDYGKNGYFWLSYYDASYLYGKNVYYFVADTDMYDNVYAYDSVANKDSGVNLSNGSSIIQEFNVSGGEKIEAIGFETLTANVEVELKIEYGDTSVTTEDFVKYIGYHTTVLDEPLTIEESGTVTVTISFTALEGDKVTIPYEVAENYSSTNSTAGGVWYINNVHGATKTMLYDYANEKYATLQHDARIKIFTNDVEESDAAGINISNIYDHAGATYQLEISGIESENITWTSNDTSVAVVDTTGLVTVGSKKGTTLITGTYMEDEIKQTVYCHVNVKPYSITYVLDEDTSGPLNRTYYPGDRANCKLTTVTKKGFYQKGWYSDNTLTNEVTETNLISMNEDLTLYPGWIQYAKVSDVSLNLSGKIGVNFYMDLPDEADHIWMADEYNNYIEYPVAEVYKKGSRYCYTYYQEAKKISDGIYIAVFDENDHILPFESSYGATDTFAYSVEEYIWNVMENAEEDQHNNPDLNKVCEALLKYGYSAKKYLGYYYYDDENIVDIEGADFSEYEPIITGLGVEDDNTESEETYQGIKYMGSSLVLDSDTSIRHYFSNQSLSEADSWDDYLFVIEEADKSLGVSPVKTGSYCYVEIKNIPAAKLGEKFEISVYKKSSGEQNSITDSSLVGKIQYSALSYCYKALSKYSDSEAGAAQYKDLAELCVSLKDYYDAACDYWGVVKDSVVKSVAAVQLSSNNLSMDIGEQKNITATCLPMDSVYSSITWNSSNPDVVSVAASGKMGTVTALQDGKALITVETDCGAWSQCLITVGDGGKLTLGDNYVDVTDYIPLCEGDTAAINAAINALTDECNTIYIPAGNYAVNACNHIYLKSNTNIIMDDEAFLNLKANADEHYSLFIGENISNVNICGGNIVGERYVHKDDKGEWGHGISLLSCNNINITGVNISACWGDGIYIGAADDASACRNISIADCVVENNRRNNLSIVAGDNILIDNCTFSYANGTDPQYGLDIEPNYVIVPCTNLSIFNSKFYGNAEYGLGIASVVGTYPFQMAVNRVNIVGCTINDGFVNFAGSDSSVSDTVIGGDTHMRTGMLIGDNVHINSGTEAEDTLVAYYTADRDDGTNWRPCRNIGGANQMSSTLVTGKDDGGRKAIRLQRTQNGSASCGCGIDLDKFSLNGEANLEVGQTYRFEYVVRGIGDWGSMTTQSDWYHCKPLPEQYLTCVTTQTVNIDAPMTFMLCVDSLGTDAYIDVETVKIYKVN